MNYKSDNHLAQAFSNAQTKLISERRYRSELGAVRDILSVIAEKGQDGQNISTISRRANLSHAAALEKCRKLMAAGLLNTIHHEKNRLFSITQSGIMFFKELQRFKEFTQPLNLF